MSIIIGMMGGEPATKANIIFVDATGSKKYEEIHQGLLRRVWTV